MTNAGYEGSEVWMSVWGVFLVAEQSDEFKALVARYNAGAITNVVRDTCPCCGNEEEVMQTILTEDAQRAHDGLEELCEKLFDETS